MSNLVEFPLDGGESVWVEVEELASAGLVVRGRGGSVEAVAQATQSFEQTLGGLTPMLTGLVERARSAAALTEVHGRVRHQALRRREPDRRRSAAPPPAAHVAPASG